MAVTLTSANQYTVDLGVGRVAATLYSFAVTVPSDAEMAIFAVGGHNANPWDIDAINWDNHATNVDFTQIDVASNNNIESMCVYYMLKTEGGVANTDWPGSGAKTIYFSTTQDVADGGHAIIFFLKGMTDVVANVVIGTQKQTASGQGNWTSPSVGTVNAGDLGIICAYQYANIIDADLLGATALYESSVEASGAITVGYEDGEDQLRVESANAYLGAVAFAIAVAAAGGVAPTSIFHGPLVGPLGGPI